MNLLLVGVGSVGEAIARVAQGRSWLDRLILADYNLERAQKVYHQLGQPANFIVAQVDASRMESVAGVARQHGADFILNAASCEYSHAIFDAAYQTSCGYMDLALHGVAETMGQYQFEQARQWEEKGLLAVVGMGMDPGVVDVFARYAHKHLFDEIDEIGIRDGSSLSVEGYPFAPLFSIYDVVEECTNPAIVWERDRGWYRVEPFSQSEVFEFPEGVGPLEVVTVEHEEVVLIPRWIPCRRVTFKYSLGETFVQIMRTIKTVGLHGRQPIDVGGVKVTPIDVLAALLPDPATLGPHMQGKSCVGTWVTGQKDGRRREVFLYQVMDNQEAMARHGVHVVALQTAIGPVIALELIAQGIWNMQGVFGPEAFDPDPFLERMPMYDFPYRILELPV